MKKSTFTAMILGTVGGILFAIGMSHFGHKFQTKHKQNADII